MKCNDKSPQARQRNTCEAHPIGMTALSDQATAPSRQEKKNITWVWPR